jgi:hypothetical protein
VLLPDRTDEAALHHRLGDVLGLDVDPERRPLAIALLELDRLGAEDNRPSPAMPAAPRTHTISGEVP